MYPTEVNDVLRVQLFYTIQLVLIEQMDLAAWLSSGQGWDLRVLSQGYTPSGGLRWPCNWCSRSNQSP